MSDQIIENSEVESPKIGPELPKNAIEYMRFQSGMG